MLPPTLPLRACKKQRKNQHMSNTEAKCFAADGITPTFTVPGQPIMVSAVDFNRVHAELADLRNAAVQAEPLYFVRLGDSAKWEETSEQIFEMSPDCYRTKLYTTPPAASAVGMTASADVG